MECISTHELLAQFAADQARKAGHALVRLLHQLPNEPFSDRSDHFSHYDEDMLASPVEPVTHIRNRWDSEGDYTDRSFTE